MKEIKIGNKIITEDGPLYFIADIAANHDGDLQRAFKLIELAKEAGVDAAKFQNFQAPKIVSQVGFESLGKQLSHQASWKKSVYEVYQDASIPLEWTKKLKKKCDEVGIEYFTAPYDFESVDLVDPYVNVHKIGSGDITWLEIVEYIAKKKKPVLLSTGASTMEDVVRAMSILELYNENVVLMQCNTNYTVSKENYKCVNLNVLKTYKLRFPNVILGLSDHTIGYTTVLGAIALGARVIEKHFTDDNLREGPDHAFAMNPKTWREMVGRAQELFAALGDGNKVIEENEKESVDLQRRCIRAKYDLTEGHVIKLEDVEYLRPVSPQGLPPYTIQKIINKKISKPLKSGEAVILDNLI